MYSTRIARHRAIDEPNTRQDAKWAVVLCLIIITWETRLSSLKLNVKKLSRRLGCALFLMVWLVVILSPCPVFVLAIRGEIVLTHSDIPEDYFRIWSIQELQLRGLGISNARRVSIPDGSVCTITDTHFILWKGQAPAAHQCSCYTRQGEANTWMSIAEGADACKLAGE